MSRETRRQLHVVQSIGALDDVGVSVGVLFSNQHSRFLCTDYAPQRALLQAKAVTVFVSHVGASSCNEAVYAGKPVITLPVYFDQIQNAMRLRDAGVSIPLVKETFTAEDVYRAIVTINTDRELGGTMSINLNRLSGIAKICARRKHLAVDLIEETIVDWEGRALERRAGAKRPRAMHLEPADARMPRWKLKNWDLWGIFGLGAAAVAAIALAGKYASG
jgi:hypothetical protein